MKTSLILIAGILCGFTLSSLIDFKFESSMLPNLLKSNMINLSFHPAISGDNEMDPPLHVDSSYTGSIRILDKKFEQDIDTIINMDPEFKHTKAGLSPIDDKLFMAYRKMFYKNALDLTGLNVKSNKQKSKQPTVYNKNSWIWISTEELMNYAKVLDSLKAYGINGTRVYIGMIDNRYLDTNFFNKKNPEVYDYFLNRQGAVMPLFVATEWDNFTKKLNDTKILAAYDCNCGNPPRYCDVVSDWCGSDKKCTNCPRPK